MVKKALLKLDYTCNMNCFFCWTNYNKKINKNYILKTTEIYKKIIHAKNFDIDTIILTGGECTITKDFFKIIDFIKREKFKLGIVTNARILSINSFFEKLLKYNLKYAYLSFYSTNESTFEKITRTRGLKQNIKGIENCINNKNIEHLVNIVIHNYNLDELENNVKYLNKINAKKIKLSLVEPTPETKNREIPNIITISKKINNIIKLYPNITFFTEGFPLCLLNSPLSTEFKEFDIYYMSEAFEKTWNKVKTKHQRIDICQNCKNNKCPGVYKTYFNLFPEIRKELKPTL